MGIGEFRSRRIRADGKIIRSERFTDRTENNLHRAIPIRESVRAAAVRGVEIWGVGLGQGTGWVLVL